MQPFVTLDSQYFECNGTMQSCTAAVHFSDWGDSTALASSVSHCDQVGEYQPGSFFLRELPSLLKALQELSFKPALVVIDGYVQLGERPGLGWHLHQALEQSCPVIGVAKNPFRSDNEPFGLAVQRGESNRAIYVTSIGLDDPQKAARWIKSMHGPFRIPTLLKLADRLAREAVLRLCQSQTACETAPQSA
jgi:deoxyribonuclease V